MLQSFDVRGRLPRPCVVRRFRLIRAELADFSEPRRARPRRPEHSDCSQSRVGRVEKFDRRGTEPIELLNIRIRAEILSEFRKFCQNSSEIQKFEDLSTFSKLFIEILINSH